MEQKHVRANTQSKRSSKVVIWNKNRFRSFFYLFNFFIKVDLLVKFGDEANNSCLEVLKDAHSSQELDDKNKDGAEGSPCKALIK